MATQIVGKRTLAVAALGGTAVLLVAGCSSNNSGSSSSSSAAAPTTAAPTTAAPAPAPASVPGPPSGAKQLSTQNEAGGVVYSTFSTSQTPQAVTDYYAGALKGAGFTITNQGSGGGGWGGHGGADSHVGGNNSTTFVEVSAGGESGHTTYFETCVGPSAAAVQQCQNGDHGNSHQS